MSDGFFRKVLFPHAIVAAILLTSCYLRLQLSRSLYLSFFWFWRFAIFGSGNPLILGPLYVATSLMDEIDRWIDGMGWKNEMDR